MGDDIIVKIDEALASDEEFDDSKPIEIEKKTFVELAEHFRKQCPFTKVQCNSCNDFFTRVAFRQHQCYKKLVSLEQDVLLNARSELLQIMLEIKKLNVDGVDLHKCFTEYDRYAPIPSKVNVHE